MHSHSSRLAWEDDDTRLALFSDLGGMAGAALLPPCWVKPDKHLPPHRNSATWAEVRRQTDEDDKVAKYHFDVVSQIERIEMVFHLAIQGF